MPGNSILDELTFDSASGTLNYKDVRYMLIRPETVVGFQKAIAERDQDLAHDAFFKGGFAGGQLSAKKYKALHQLDDDQLIAFMMDMGTQIGWGHFKLQNFDFENKILEIIVNQSAFAQAYGQSSSAVCHLINGVMSGLASVIFNIECAGSEVRCLAKGDAHCVFEIHARKVLISRA
jgi:predicted hydrocarbon binding protein